MNVKSTSYLQAKRYDTSTLIVFHAVCFFVDLTFKGSKKKVVLWQKSGGLLGRGGLSTAIWAIATYRWTLFIKGLP